MDYLNIDNYLKDLLKNVKEWSKNEQTTYVTNNELIRLNNIYYNKLSDSDKKIIDITFSYVSLNYQKIPQLQTFYVEGLLWEQEFKRKKKKIVRNVINLITRLYKIVKLVFNNDLSITPITNLGTEIISSSTSIINTINVVLEDNNENFGHKQIIWQGLDLPHRDETIKDLLNSKVSKLSNLYGSYGSYGSSNDMFLSKKDYNNSYNIEKRNKTIKDSYESGQLKPTDDSLFKLSRIGIDNLKFPISTDNPVLSVSIFKTNLNENISSEWANKYLMPGLAQLISYNNYIPNGGIIVYIDYYTLENFKLFSPEKLVIDSLVKNYPSIYYEESDKNNDVNKSLERFDTFIKTQNPIFANAYEKFIYYYYFASKIYNSTDTDEQIKNNKAADLFVYHFGGNFTEINKFGKQCHITNGYIGQLVRYICLRQQNYTYNGITINRNKHYIWRDAHANQTAINDAEMIKKFNLSSKNSNQKKYNLIPKNYMYIAPWHAYTKCPANESNFYIRSAIGGHIQMTNFTTDSKWNDDLDYLQLLGIAFVIDNDENIPLKLNRPFFLYGTEIKSDYDYGIEEYLFVNLFVLDIFIKYNIYFNEKFDFEVNFNNNDNNDNYEKKVLLLLYIYIKDKLPENFYMKDTIMEIESLRNNPPANINTHKWLSYLLAIYPTKYFIRSAIFSQSIYDRNNYNDIFKYQYKKSDIDAKIELYSELIYKTNINDYTWELLNEINLNCNTPIITSGIEWCTNPYLKNKNDCPKDEFFSGFYNEKKENIKYGIFKNPVELQNVLTYIDINITFGKNIPLYKNIIKNKVSDKVSDSKNMYYIKYMKYKNKYFSLKNM